MLRDDRGTGIMIESFLEQAKKLFENIEPLKVLRARVYKIGDANVLIRAATMLNTQQYFLSFEVISVLKVNSMN